MENAADFGGKHKIIPLFPAQRVARAEFREAVAIHRRGIVEPDARIPGTLEHRVRGLVVYLAENIANRRSAKGKGRHIEINTTEFPLG